jgi:hypothetical protein
MDAIGSIGTDHVQLGEPVVDDHVLGPPPGPLQLEAAHGQIASPVVVVRVAQDGDEVLQVGTLAVLAVGEDALAGEIGARPLRRPGPPALPVDPRQDQDPGPRVRPWFTAAWMIRYPSSRHPSRRRSLRRPTRPPSVAIRVADVPLHTRRAGPACR